MELINNSNGRIVLHSPISQTDLLKEYRKSDFIVNIGNRTNTQVASKILEYIGSGKPIINFYNLDDDTSRPYFKGYPMYFELKETNNISKQVIDDFMSFCNENKGRSLTFEEAYAHNPDLTTENIVKIIYNSMFN